MRLLMDDPEDRLGMNAIGPCQRSLGRSSTDRFSDPGNLCVGELALAKGSVLGNCVSHVVGMRSGEEMIRTNATPYVATMADRHPRRDGSDSEFIGDVMGSVMLKLAVSVNQQVVRPEPATKRAWLALDLLPESGGSLDDHEVVGVEPHQGLQDFVGFSHSSYF